MILEDLFSLGPRCFLCKIKGKIRPSSKITLLSYLGIAEYIEEPRIQGFNKGAKYEHLIQNNISCSCFPLKQWVFHVLFFVASLHAITEDL